MMILRVCQLLTLWGLVFAAWAHAWMSSVAASTYDARVPWGAAACLLGWALALVLIRVGPSIGLRLIRVGPGSGLHLHRLDLTRHGLALLFAALAAAAMSHVGPHMSIRVVREEVPPIFLWVYPAFAAWVPLWLSAGARTRSAADQVLVLTVFVTALAGALLFLSPAAAVGLGLLALVMQLVTTDQRTPRDALLWIAAALVILFALAAMSGINRIDATPSLRWIVAFSALGLAVAWRRRDEQGWRDVLGASIAAAVVVAVCGVLLTAYLAHEVAPGPALRSRLVLFRQHPNFLAPFFGFHAVLAIALGMRRRAGSLAWLLAALLLLASTYQTDSRTGIGATVVALLLLPGWPVLAAVQRRIRLRWVFGALLVLALAGGYGLRWLDQQGKLTAITSRVTRLQESMAFRADAWENSVAVTREHPWNGVGPQTFVSVVDFRPESRFFNAPESPHPHDVFLYVAQSAGVPALLLFLLWMGVLLRRVWRRYTGPPEDVPRALLGGVLAAAVGLLLANVLDLGLSLESVVPAPLFLITGLLVSDRPAHRGPAGRPVRPLLWALALLLVFVSMAYRPVRAETHVVRAELLAYDAGQSGGRADLMDRAREALRTAIRQDASVPRAHELLSRWCEDLEEGFHEARDVLQDRIALAPEHAEGHALLGQLFMRNLMYAEAAEEFRLALADRQGSPHQMRNRALMITCVARTGDRDAALEALVDALGVDTGVHHQIAWMDPPAPPQVLQVGLDPTVEDGQPFISLVEALEILYARHVADRRAGIRVGRTAWMDLYRAFREAGQDARAAEMLDDLEANEPDVEDWTIAMERAELAFDAGEYALAAELFEKAYELSPDKRPWFLRRAAEARREMGETVAAAEQAQSALDAWWEILDLPDAFQKHLTSEAQGSIERGDPAGGADWLHRSLLFEDELLERVRLLHRVARLNLEGGDHAACEDAAREALAALDAKPFPWTMLVDGHLVSLPGRLAATLTAAWRAEGLNTEERLHRAWSLPAFFSSRGGATLFRMAFYLENGLADRLVREAELALLGDPGHQPALWSLVIGLDGSGRHAEVDLAMRTLAEEYAKVASAERQSQALVDAYTAHPPLMDDPAAWLELAMLRLLLGGYPEAIGLFQGALDRIEGDPEHAADVSAWKALAARLAGKHDIALEALIDGVRLDPSDDMLRQRREVAVP